MDHAITVFLKLTPKEFLEVIRELGEKMGSRSRSPFRIEKGLDSSELKAEVRFHSVAGGKGEGRILVIGSGIDAWGDVAGGSVLEVSLPDEDLQELRPMWKKVMGDLKRRRVVVRAFSGGIDPMVFLALGDRTKPTKEDSIDTWFAYRFAVQIHGGSLPLKKIAEEKGLEEGTVRNKHVKWKKRYGMG